MTDELDEHHEPLLQPRLIGSLLRAPQHMSEVLQLVSVQDLANNYGVIYSALAELWTQDVPISNAAVADVLYKKGTLKDAGDYIAIHRLWDEEPTGVHAVYYAKLIREKTMMKRLAVAGDSIKRLAEHPDGPLEEVLGQAEALLFQVSQLGREAQTDPVDVIVEEECDRIDERCQGRDDNGVHTGLIDLDNTLGHMKPGELIIVAARPSVGKTSLALTVMYHGMIQQSLEVLLVSLEQAKSEIAARLIIMESRVPSSAYRTGHLNQDQRTKLAEAARRLTDCKGHVDDCPTQRMVRIMANARRLKTQHAIGLVIVDYLQLIEPDNRKEPRQEQVSGIARRLKQLARQLQVPVMALCQLNRQAEKEEPRLSHLRESGDIEASADTVILLHKKDEANTDTVEAIVAKQRNGPTGRVSLAYRKEIMKFENLAYPGQNGVV